MRQQGVVKWWNNKQGWGFITDSSGQDLLVRHDRICGDGFKELRSGERVSFEVREGARGPYAAAVERATDDEAASSASPSDRRAS
ncbi:MAG: cold-shock protein [Candidatus Eisenbacteria bacterium]|nr:cold-shock protein [Candidatus Eisenbacteria bacterium]